MRRMPLHLAALRRHGLEHSSSLPLFFSSLPLFFLRLPLVFASPPPLFFSFLLPCFFLSLPLGFSSLPLGFSSSHPWFLFPSSPWFLSAPWKELRSSAATTRVRLRRLGVWVGLERADVVFLACFTGASLVRILSRQETLCVRLAF